MVEWLDRMNNGDAWGAADLEVFSKMDFSSYNSEVQYLEAILVDLGTYKLSLNYAHEISKDQVSTED